MTTESVRKYSKEIAALGEGKVIQSRYRRDSGVWTEWQDDHNPSFSDNPNVEYRVKPEPREWWMLSLKTGRWVEKCENKLDAETRLAVLSHPDGYEIIHVREVL